MTGRRVGQYEVFEKLGDGGMGSVYRAVDTMVNREAAIKVLRADLAANPEVLERFRTEASTLARLNHPNIALLYSFFREGSEYFMAMEYVPGRTLSAILQQHGALPYPHAVEIMLGVLEALKHAHRMGILHRDIKPANIIVTPEGVVKVTDFGIARALRGARLTREGRLVGTLEYVAPERALGRDSDARADLYSAGVVFYEMLSGRLPFEAPSDYELMRAQIETPAPDPRQLGVQIPAAVAQVLATSLSKTPEARYPDAETMAAALRAALAGGPRPTTLAAPAVAVPAPTRLAEPAYTPAPAAAPAVAPAASVAQGRRIPKQAQWAGIALAGLSVVGVGAYLGSRQQRPVQVTMPAAEAPANPAPVAVEKPPAVNPLPPLEAPVGEQPAPVEQTPAAPPTSPEIKPPREQKRTTEKAAPAPKPAPAAPPQETRAQAPSVPPPPPVSEPAPAEPVKVEPVKPAAAEPKPAHRGLDSIHYAKSIFVEADQNGLDALFRQELRSQLGQRLPLSSSAGAAQTVLRIQVEREDEGGRVVGGAGRVIGLRGRKRATVGIYDTATGRLLWQSVDTDRRGAGGITGGGDRKLVERIVNKLRKELE